VVLVAIPVTLALTLLVYSLLGYTLNRITLFALIFSIGILVDDAIVVVENIHRHFAMHDGRSLRQVAVDAVAEVGNPTLLATWAVIAAILPMAFVSGLMGPYMRPIPVGASVAMMFSLGIAFYFSVGVRTHVCRSGNPKSLGPREESFLDRGTENSWGDRCSVTRFGGGFIWGGRWRCWRGPCPWCISRKSRMKMLPFDNKNEFEVVLTCLKARPWTKPNKRRRRSAKPC
jgi:hypothetical protein